MVREEVMRQNIELFKQVRKEMQGKKGFVPYYSEAYVRAKKLLDKRKNGISITVSIE